MWTSLAMVREHSEGNSVVDLVHLYDTNNTEKRKLHVDVFGDGK
jgi:hypothetical protein